MNKKYLVTLFFILSAGTYLNGQTIPYNWESKRTRADAIFNSSKDIILHRHNVNLENGARIIFEIADVDDYNDIRNLDSIISAVAKSILTHRDSLDIKEYKNTRVDFVVSDNLKSTYLRYNTYPKTEHLLLSRKGELSQLKIESDTVRIRIYRPRNFIFSDSLDMYRMLGRGNSPYFPIQITILLNNYYELENAFKDYELNQIVDTLHKLTRPVKWRDKRGYWYGYSTQAYIQSTPRDNIKTAIRIYGLNEDGVYHAPVRTWNFHGNVGAALIQNKLAPFAEIGLKYKWAWSRGSQEYAFLATYVSPCFLFEKHVDGTYHTYDSWFVNFEGGARVDEEYLGVEVRGGAIGGSYLLNPDGLIFRNTTAKLYFSLHLRKSVTLTPELIFTDNFKSIFPGITVKVF